MIHAFFTKFFAASLRITFAELQSHLTVFPVWNIYEIVFNKVFTTVGRVNASNSVLQLSN